MLKIMFVDDEISVLNGLTHGYDWNSLGFEIAATAMNVETALEKFYEAFPDVIITDICMKERDGIFLISELKAIYPQVEIIVLSGYPEFQYAKAALEQGVFAYLLKPLKNSELFKTLDRVKAKIEQRQNPSSLFLSELLYLTAPTTDSINALCHKYAIALPQKSYTLAVVQFLVDSPVDMPEILAEICTDFSVHLNRYYNTFTCQPRPHHIAILIYHEQMASSHSLYVQLDFLKNKVIEQYHKDLAIGISNCFTDILSIRDAYLQALFAVSQKSFFGSDCTITYNENSPLLSDNSLSSSCFLQLSQQEELLHGIKNGNKQLVLNIFSSYFKKLNTLHNLNIEIIKNALLDLTFQIIHSTATDAAQMHLIFGKALCPALEIQQMTHLSEIQTYIYGIIDKILAYQKSHVTGNYSKLVADTLLFIMNNYALPISIETIAQELYVDRYQLMKTFKAETGDTINNYLINYRMNIAADFLQKGKYSVQEISIRVGYQDTGYFSKIFKKHMGCSPTEYASQEK